MPENPKDIQKMQLDAERRIREMQRRSDTYLRGNEKPPVPNFSNTNQYRHNEQPSNRNGDQNVTKQNQQSRGYQHQNRHQSQQQNQQQNQPANRPAQNPPPQPKSGFLSRFKGLDILKIFNFQNLHIDNDVAIIVALIFLLSTEETDELLLMALIYIML